MTKFRSVALSKCHLPACSSFSSSRTQYTIKSTLHRSNRTNKPHDDVMHVTTASVCNFSTFSQTLWYLFASVAVVPNDNVADKSQTTKHEFNSTCKWTHSVDGMRVM